MAIACREIAFYACDQAIKPVIKPSSALPRAQDLSIAMIIRRHIQDQSIARAFLHHASCMNRRISTIADTLHFVHRVTCDSNGYLKHIGYNIRNSFGLIAIKRVRATRASYSARTPLTSSIGFRVDSGDHAHIAWHSRLSYLSGVQCATVSNNLIDFYLHAIITRPSHATNNSFISVLVKRETKARFSQSGGSYTIHLDFSTRVSKTQSVGEGFGGKKENMRCPRSQRD